MCSFTHKKYKNPMLVLLQVTNGDKQQNKKHVFVSVMNAFQVFQV